MNNNYILAAITISKGAANFFMIARIVFLALMVILSIFMIVIIMLQPSNQEGLGAISGSSDTFFSKNKGRTREGMLKKLTVICAITLAVMTVLFFLSLIISDQVFPGKVKEILQAVIKK